jgi:serine phosphatase RsbU (regulator of sigma subunit)
LIKILFFKLSSFRRILLILALFLIFTANNNGDTNSGKIIIGALLFFFIILLELKDKLLARDELEAGRSIQQALAPKTNPFVPGWDLWLYTRPANDVGGDLRAVAPDFPSLDNLAGKLNSIFNRDSLPNRFASMLYLEIKSDSDEIQFVNAGHFPPIVSGHGQIKEMEKGAPALGIMPDSTFRQESYQLKIGDLFIVYSDGVTEARNEVGDFFGENKLKELLTTIEGLTATQAGTKILETVDNFIGEANATDDLSLIILRRIA